MRPVWNQTDPLQELVDEHHEQIENYRRVESQRVGSDIGWDWAAEEWMAKHFPDWKQLQWDRLVAETARVNYLRLAGN